MSILLDRKDRILNLNWIVEQWDRLGHFYAYLGSGHVTASTAMKRLNGYTGKNNFYCSNRKLGRFFKTEHILQYLSDKTLRQRIWRGQEERPSYCPALHSQVTHLGARVAPQRCPILRVSKIMVTICVMFS